MSRGGARRAVATLVVCALVLAVCAAMGGWIGAAGGVVALAIAAAALRRAGWLSRRHAARVRSAGLRPALLVAGSAGAALLVRTVAAPHPPAWSYALYAASLVAVVLGWPAMRPPRAPGATAPRPPRPRDAWLAAGAGVGAVAAWRAGNASLGFAALAFALLLCFVRRLSPARLPAHESSGAAARLAALLVVLAAGLFLRFWDLWGTPPGIWIDEPPYVTNAYSFLRGTIVSPLDFVPHGFHQAGLVTNGLGSLALAIFGPTVVAFRGVDALTGGASCAAFYCLLRTFLPVRAALPAALLWTFGRMNLFGSRVNYLVGTGVLFEILAVYFLFLASRSGRKLHYGLSGLAAGLLVYCYSGFRLFLLAYPLLPLAARLLPGSLPPPRVRGTVLALGVAALVLWPALLYGMRQEGARSFLPPHGEETSWLAGPDRGAAAREAWRRLAAALVALTVAGNAEARDAPLGSSYLEPTDGGLALAGAAMALRGGAHFLPAAAIAGTVAGAAQTTFGDRFFRGALLRRFAGGAPWLYLLVAFAVASVVLARYRSRWGRRIGAGAVWVLVAVSCVLNFRGFFLVWPGNPAVYLDWYTARYYDEVVRPLAACPRAVRLFLPRTLAEYTAAADIARIACEMKEIELVPVPPADLARIPPGRPAILLWPASAGALPAEADPTPLAVLRARTGEPASSLHAVAAAPKTR